jgi:Zn-dependent M28 family amino/carboxypeptidase
MKKYILLLTLLSAAIFVQAQKVDKLITEKSVARVIQSLSADEMMGRPSARPELMEKATAFIENEFKEIGLKPLKGLTGFRQEFQKERITPGSATIVVDGETIPADRFLVVSEKAEVNFSSGLNIVSIKHDAAIQNNDQFFFSKAFPAMNDSTAKLILIGNEFKSGFETLKHYMTTRFASGRKGTTIFVFGKDNATSYSISAKQNIQKITMINVVGQLEGSGKAEEMVVFSGHYDHLGVEAPNAEGDSIANGADDDASGTTAVIELARYFKKLKKNNRTLIFVAFTAEEIGGYGSKYFSQQLNPDKVVAMFNIEMIGKASKWGQNSAFITGFERSDFGEILQKNLKGTQFEFKADPYPDQNLFYRSDNATLARLGVPAHTISTDQIDIDKFYHTVDDEFQTLDVANILATIRAIALSSRSIVDGTDTPKRIDKSTVD